MTISVVHCLICKAVSEQDKLEARNKIKKTKIHHLQNYNSTFCLTHMLSKVQK